MIYNFIINKYIEDNTKQIRVNPLIVIKNSEKYGYFFETELNNLELDYVEEIVEKIEEILNGKTDFYEGFGFELYMIECDRENAVVKNIFENDKIEAIIPIQEVYELMRDWRDYLKEFYKK